jgi:hypothetical protein
MAALLMAHATEGLPPLAAGTNHSSSSSSCSGGGSSSSSSSSSGSELTGMLWQQLEQSGLLQQLPDAAGAQARRIQVPLDQSDNPTHCGLSALVKIKEHK